MDGLPQYRLRKWKRLASAAAPGPWPEAWGFEQMAPHNDMVRSYGCGPQRVSRGQSIDGADRYLPSERDADQMRADAAFIAAAREAMPALIAEVERLQALVSQPA